MNKEAKAKMEWPRLLAYITGRVDQELLLRNEYLAAENRILRAKIKGRLQLSGGEKSTLAEIARRLGRKALAEVAVAAKPDTILRWFRRLVARKFDGSRFRQSVGRPRVDQAVENLIVRMARDNPTWGYDRIVGALANLGHTVSDQTVGNILKRHGIAPAPQRKHSTRWSDFIRAHMDVLTGTDFFTVEVLTLKGLMTYYVLFFIQLETRRVCLAAITPYPDQQWMEKQARNVIMKDWGSIIRRTKSPVEISLLCYRNVCLGAEGFDEPEGLFAAFHGVAALLPDAALGRMDHVVDNPNSLACRDQIAIGDEDASMAFTHDGELRVIRGSGVDDETFGRNRPTPVLVKVSEHKLENLSSGRHEGTSHFGFDPGLRASYSVRRGFGNRDGGSVSAASSVATVGWQ